MAATNTSTTRAATATAIDYAETGRRFETFRRLERQRADIKARDPFSGELAARGELQRAHDQALAAVRELVDAVIDAEEAEAARAAADAAAAAEAAKAPEATAKPGLLSYVTGQKYE